MKPAWRIEDLIDLEYFLKKDEEEDAAAISLRDRHFFLTDISPRLKLSNGFEKKDRKAAIRIWLESRRKTDTASGEKQLPSPGKLFADLLSLVSVILLITGTVTGAGLAFGVLQYKGSEPINVSTYLGVFVLLQILLIGLLLTLSICRRFITSLRYLSFVHWIIGSLVSSLFQKAAIKTRGSLSADTRNRLSAISGMIKGQKHLYGSVFYWPLFMLTQLFGIGFNLGALGASLLRIMGSDLAFGWQSTIQFSAQAVYLFVKTMALPWSFYIPPPLAHPTYGQIIGSHMVLKEGIYRLTTPDLVSWWPFLLLSVCYYGFLPRLVLFITAVVAKRKAIGKLELNHSSCNRLLRHMTTPNVETEGQRIINQDLSASENQFTETPKIIQEKWGLPAKDCWVLVPEDLADLLRDPDLEGLMNHVPGISLNRRITISADFEKDHEALAEMTSENIDENNLAILLVQEGWMPPIAESLLYLTKLRELLGHQVAVIVFLIGKPASDHGFTAVDARDWRIWKQAVETLSDPFLEIIGLGDTK